MRGTGAVWVEEGNAAELASGGSGRKGHRALKKINLRVNELKEEQEKSGKRGGKVHLMFQDEAGRSIAGVSLESSLLSPAIMSGSIAMPMARWSR